MSTTKVISNPFPLGLIQPGASFGTVSKAITVNYPDLALTTSPNYAVDSIYIHALASNTGKIYLCNTAANPDESAYVNVLDYIAIGGFTAITSAAMNTLVLSQFFIGADNSGDGCLVLVKFR